jgi:hypothetical protein
MDNQSALWHISRHAGQLWEQRWRSWIDDLRRFIGKGDFNKWPSSTPPHIPALLSSPTTQAALPSYLWAGISEELVVSARFRVAPAPIWGICDVPGGVTRCHSRGCWPRCGNLTSPRASWVPRVSCPHDPRMLAPRSAGVTPVGTYLDLVLHHDGGSEWRDSRHHQLRNRGRRGCDRARPSCGTALLRRQSGLEPPHTVRTCCRTWIRQQRWRTLPESRSRCIPT